MKTTKNNKNTGKCRICGKHIADHHEADLLICNMENKARMAEENEERKKGGYELDSIDGGVFTFDC